MTCAVFVTRTQAEKALQGLNRTFYKLLNSLHFIESEHDRHSYFVDERVFQELSSLSTVNSTSCKNIEPLHIDFVSCEITNFIGK